MTLTEFAARAGYSLNYASQVELGNSNGGPKYLRAAADLLNCEITDISIEGKPRRRRRRPVAVVPPGTAEKRARA